MFSRQMSLSLRERRQWKGVELAFQASAQWGRTQTINLGKGKQVLWLPTHHPRHGKFFTESKEWGSESQPWIKFAQKVCEFMSQS